MPITHTVSALLCLGFGSAWIFGNSTVKSPFITNLIMTTQAWLFVYCLTLEIHSVLLSLLRPSKESHLVGRESPWTFSTLPVGFGRSGTLRSFPWDYQRPQWKPYLTRCKKSHWTPIPPLKKLNKQTTISAQLKPHYYSLYLGRVKNPIWLAEKVLEHSPHCLLASEGAERFALSHGITPVPNESLISPDAKKAWNHFKGSGPNYDKLSTQEGFSINETGHDTIGMTAAGP